MCRLGTRRSLTRIFGHRFYHEAPNDVFELPWPFLSGVDKSGDGKGGLNALRLVSKRCNELANLLATRLTHKADASSLPVCALRRCKRIQYIRCASLRSLEGCTDGLKSLEIRNGQVLESLAGLSACCQLESLKVSSAYEISDLSPLSSCTRIKRLIILHSVATDLTPLSNLPILEELNFFRQVSYPSIENVAPLSHCKKLKRLNIAGNKDIEDLSPLSRCHDLEELSISGLDRIRDLSFLEKGLFDKGFSKLRLLNISGLPISDLSPLISLLSLEDLHCYHIPSTTRLIPLLRCHKLKNLNCSSDAKDLDQVRLCRPDLRL